MNILYWTYLLNAGLMILLPLALAFFLAYRLEVHWRLWWIGAAAMVASQAGHIPFNILLTALFQRQILPAPPVAWKLAFNAVILGLSAGLWETSFRYIAYRWWVPKARSWSQGLMLGAGHGGIESITLGLFALSAYLNMVALHSATDLSGLVPAEQIAAVQQALADYWSAPWYLSLMGAVERFGTLIFHLSASLLVLQVFVRRQLRWFWLAVAWHAALDGIAVAAMPLGILRLEGLLLLFVPLNLALIFYLRRPAAEAPPAPLPGTPSLPGTLPLPGTQPQPVASPQDEIQETPENLEQTRFSH